MSKAVRRIRLIALLTFASLSLVACGGDDEESTASASPPPSSAPPSNAPPSNAPPPSGGNRAPTIAGTPLTSVMQGTAYSFTPNATDADSNTLTFSVANLPRWASFNSSTGRVSGTPNASHVGTYSNVTISVSDGSASASLAPFTVQVVATATGSAMLSWTPPTRNTDGTALTDLAGYKVYWGLSPGNYTNSVTLNNPGLTSYVVDQLTPATWHFALTALNASGAESVFSNAASKTVR